MTREIYQLNKYDKAWLLFTVEFQELLVIFWKTYRLNSREFFTFTCIHTLRLQKHGFLYETGFLPGFKFFTSLLSWFSCVLCVLLFWNDSLRMKEPRFRGPNLKSRQMRWYAYIHTCIHAHIHTYIHTHTHTYLHPKIWNLRLASGTGDPGWSRTRPELACCEATN